MKVGDLVITNQAATNRVGKIGFITHRSGAGADVLFTSGQELWFALIELIVVATTHIGEEDENV